MSTLSHTIRFAGDSGDGIQLQGLQFTRATAHSGHDLATFPDFPAEIRAPHGTRFGVSAFQIQFGGETITTPGDTPGVLVAFNPAALIVNLADLQPGATIIVDTHSFNAGGLKRAELASNPLEDGSLARYDLHPIDITSLTVEAVKEFGLGNKQAGRCKNFWALGLALWMYDQSREQVVGWIEKKFAADEQVRNANLAALNAGHAYGETTETAHRTPVPRAPLPEAEYRTITGAEALALGLVAAGELADTELMFCSYPITPASSLLHHLTGLEDAGVATFQAEDEIAAVCAAIGASYAGKLGVTSSSGPGIALKTEAIGLAVAAELPLVIVNSQRAGPSTGMPTKTEQSDLFQAVYGRNGDTPLPVVAAATPGDCFDAAIEAVRIALRHMTPVMLLTDGYIANASDLWPIPDLTHYKPIRHRRPDTSAAPGPVFERDPADFARIWATPGDARFIHRVGGLERDIVSGNISYDAANHQAMTDLRAAKVASAASFIDDQKPVHGADHGLAVIGWGSTYGAIYQAVRHCHAEGHAVAHIHLRHINPLPENLELLLQRYDTVLIPELNTGQLASWLRDQLLLDARSLTKVTGKPFTVAELRHAIAELAPRGEPAHV